MKYPGKKFGREKSRELSMYLLSEISKLDVRELKALISTCKQFTHTNCGWVEFNCKEAIINLAENRVREILDRKTAMMKNFII